MSFKFVLSIQFWNNHPITIFSLTLGHGQTTDAAPKNIYSVNIFNNSLMFDSAKINFKKCHVSFLKNNKNLKIWKKLTPFPLYEL